MEAVTIVGIAVVAVGGFYSFLDLLADLGIRAKTSRYTGKNSPLFGNCLLASQKRIKKMAGVNI